MDQVELRKKFRTLILLLCFLIVHKKVEVQREYLTARAIKKISSVSRRTKFRKTNFHYKNYLMKKLKAATRVTLIIFKFRTIIIKKINLFRKKM